MLKKPVWNTIETTLFYYSDNMATAHVCPWSNTKENKNKSFESLQILPAR